MSHQHLRTIRSFVCRSGRISKAQRQALSELYAGYRIHTAENQWTAEKIFNNTYPFIVEIGFGMGDSLYQLSLTHQKLNFLGYRSSSSWCCNLDPKTEGVLY